MSFTLNIRLVFTPLFGDYSLAGRIIGFFVRIFEIIFGIVFMLVFTLVALTLPLTWWLLPIAITHLFGTGALSLIILGQLLYFTATTRNKPAKKVAAIKDGNYEEACRPLVKNVLKQLNSNWQNSIRFLVAQNEIKFLLLKSELYVENLIKDVATSAPQNATKVLEETYKLAVAQHTKYVELEQLFITIINGIPKADMLMSQYGTTLASLLETETWLVTNREENDKLFIWQEDYQMLFTGGIGKGMTGRVTPMLDSVSTDYTREAQHGRIRQIIGREKEIKKIAGLLTGSKDNILIIGAPGSGKTSIVKGIAYEIIAGTEYKALKNKRIVNLEIGGVIAGTKTSGEIAGNLRALLKETRGSGDIILFIDEIHNLVTGSSDNSAETSTLYSILEPELAAGQLQVIGATSIQNYRKYIEPNGSFNRIFQTIEIEPTTKQETIEILKAVSRSIEVRHKTLITYPALTKTVELSEKLIHERVLPDKAVDILERASEDNSNEKGIVNKVSIEKEIAELTHIPIEKVSMDDAKKLLDIEKDMQKMVIGQDEAINQIGAALKRARIGIRDEGKPIASFLFVGTTGVGKTQTAKALAKCYFGDTKNMIRLDMSEYQQLDSIDKLLGSPDGKSRGYLTESVRTRPFALVLLDEIEKAQPNLLLTFLQVLDEGRLTDASGTVVDFTNTIIIATSNTGTRSIQEVFAQDGTLEEMKVAAMKDVRSKFAPEFLNRFTGIIVFNPLTRTNLKAITLLLLESVRKLADAKGIKISFRDDLIEQLIKLGYSPEWGARPLARIIEDTVESYLATKMLANEIKQGDDLTLGLEVLQK